MGHEGVRGEEPVSDRKAKPRRRGPRERRADRGRRGEGRPAETGEVTVLYGWHPVAEALRNERRRLRRLLATDNAARRLADEIGRLRVEPEMVRPGEIDRLLEPDAVHQGLYLEADPLPSPMIEDLGNDALILVLDQITDPHNVGAIVRTAAAFAVDAIVTTARHSPAATGVLAKAASGGLEHVPFIVVRNLAETLIALGERGFQRLGFDSEAERPLGELPVRRPVALVLGAEGKGLRHRTRECCDALGRLDVPGAIKSLNVSNAAAVALYALTQKAGIGTQSR
jgi:23S rRNA (guanosine2251-2'-O)-methyltransferase